MFKQNLQMPQLGFERDIVPKDSATTTDTGMLLRRLAGALVRSPLESSEITVHVWKNGDFVTDSILIRPDTPWNMSQVTTKYGTKLTSYQPFDCNGRMLNWQTCLSDITEDGSNTLHLAPPEIMAEKTIMDAVAKDSRDPTAVKEPSTDKDRDNTSGSPEKRIRYSDNL